MENWQTKKLGEICRLIKGKKPKKFVPKSNVPYLTAKVIRGSVLPKFVGEDCPSSVLVKEDQIIIIMDGSNSGEIFTGLNGALATTMGIIEFSRDLLTSKYLLHFLNFHRERFTKSRTGSAIPHLSKEEFENLEISLPPLPEQRRLVALLDDLFEKLEKAKENAEKNLHNAKDLFDSCFESYFDDSKDKWEEFRMDKLCFIESKLIDPKEERYLDLTHVGAGNIESKTGKLHSLQTAKEEKLKSGKFLFDDSMVLYSKIRPYLMKVVRPNFKGLCSADIYPLSINHSLIVRDYLYYLLLSRKFTDYAIKGSGRAGMPKVNRTHLFAYKVKIPTIQEQKIIVEKLNNLSVKIYNLESIYKKKLAQLNDLKQSILHQAFTGKL